MEAQDLNQEGNAGEVMESLGVSDEPSHNEGEEKHETEAKPSNETLAVQKRLKSQKRAHEREVRDLHARIGELESRMTQPNNTSQTPNYGMNSPVDEQIHKAVSYALQAKDAEERKARDAQQAAHVQRQYQDLHRHLDSMGDKYDDFHDVVYGDTPYTAAMRDYSLTLPRQGAGSAGEVLYKLGKNPEELRRIANLHPLDQASELSKLSHALISGGNNAMNSTKAPLGNIKSNPVVNSHAVNDKTPISSIRERMKTGNWK